MLRSPLGRLFATLPLAIGCAVAAATLNGAMARKGDELRLEKPAPPAQVAPSAPVHHDDVYDPSELISV